MSINNPCFIDRRSSGSSPSNSPRLSEKNVIETDPCVDDSNVSFNKEPVVNNSQRFCKEKNHKSSPKIVSSLVTNNKNLEGKANLIAPIAVTEELEADDCETESETNEGNKYIVI